MKLKLSAALAPLLAGCATSVAPFIEHQSHATQHPPFVAHNTAYGADQAGIAVNWDITKRAHLSVSEAVTLERRAPYWQEYGEIAGPREAFEARVSFDIWRKQ